MKKFSLAFSSHMRYKGFVQLIPLSFLSSVFKLISPLPLKTPTCWPVGLAL